MPLEEFVKKQMRRIKPYKGMVVDVDVWDEAHRYHRDRQRLHAIAMHQHGIVAGLEVLARDPPDGFVAISPGIAVDHKGNTIVASNPKPQEVKAEETGIVYVTLEYREPPPEGTPSPDTRRAGPVYITEGYAIEVQPERPAEPYLELARIVVKGQKAVIKDAQDPFNPGPNEIDTRYRRVAGPMSRGHVSLALWDNPGWMRHQEGLSHLALVINQSTDYDALFKGAIALGDEIQDCDLLCMCGDAAFTLTKDQDRVLSDFMDKGGVILGEACGEADEGARAFRQAFGSLAERLKRAMKPVNRGHPLLKVHYLFATPPVGLGGPALLVEDRGMIHSDYDYGCVWAGGRADNPRPREMIRSALEIGVNIAIYAHQRRRYHELRATTR